MIPEQLRLHLSARRPGGQDDADPAIAEALAQAAEQPEVASWAEAEKKADAAICAKIKQVQPPPGLRDRILAGASVGRRSWWSWFNSGGWSFLRNSELVAIAAVVLLLASAITINYVMKPAKTWQLAAAEEISRIESSEVPLMVTSSKLPAVHEWLVQQTCPAPRDLRSMPAAVKELGLLGCTKMVWRGNTVSIMCFQLDSENEVHLVIISRANLPDAPPVDTPVYATVNGYSTASWSDKDLSMMLIGKVPMESLQKLLGAATASFQDARPVYVRF